MPPTSPVHLVDAAAFDASKLAQLVHAAAEADGTEPLNEAALLELTHRGVAGSALYAVPSADSRSGSEAASGAAGLDGFAWVHGEPREPEVELVVAPSARGRGVGSSLTAAVLGDRSDAVLSAWSHGNHPAAAALADRFGWQRVRDLWVMRRPLPGGGGDELPPVAPGAGIVVRPFEPGRDEEAFLALNAEAFAGHPEQGRMTRADLEERMTQPWFDAGGFFLAEAREGGSTAGAGDLLGFHWTKVHPGEPPHGEVYVVGVSPRAQGTGLGRLLTLTGLHHLAGLGLEEVVLYVESDNAPAVAVYSRLGFTHADHDTHVMYRHSPPR